MTLNHARTGSGEPLVLLHGIGSCRQVWDPVISMLADQHTVVALDLPGFGDSDPLPGAARPTLAAMVDAAAAFLSEAGLSHPHVAGNSMGGWISLELARQGLARSAIAISPAGFWSRREAEFCRRSLRLSYAVARAIAPAARTLCASPAGRTLLLGQVVARPWLLPADASALMLVKLAGSQGFLDLLEDITRRAYAPTPAPPVPVTIAWGERDRLLLPRQARRAQRAIPGARNVALAGLGHVPMGEGPAAVAAVILKGTRGDAG